MTQEDPLDSSKPNFDIDFRIFNNNEQIINKIKSFGINSNEIFNKIEDNDEETIIIKHKIHIENGAPFILLKTNLNKHEIKLMIDTGASISLISKDVIKEDINKTDIEVNIFGIVGKDISVRTKGMVNAVFKIDERFLATTFHIVDQQYAGPAHGYLGFDFFNTYRVIINLNEMCLIINVKNVMQNNINTANQIKEKKEKFFFNHLAHNYDFETSSNASENIAKNDIENNSKMIFEFSVDELAQKTEMKNMITNNYNFSTNQQSNMKKERERIEYIYKKLKLQECYEEEKKSVRKICESFLYQFHIDGDILGSTNIVEHTIDLIPGSKPVNVRQYRIPQSLKKTMEDCVLKFEQMGIIEKSQSKWNSPAILVAKKDESGNKTDYRFVVDYRKLNEITEIPCSVMPLIDEVFINLGGNEYYTCLDLKHAFYYLNIKKSHREYTSFTVGNFQWQFKKMAMGLSGAPHSWQRAMNLIFQNLLV